MLSYRFGLSSRRLLFQHRTFSSRTSARALTVWWDSACPLCTKEIKMMKRLDTKHEINFVALTPNAPTPLVMSPERKNCPLTTRELLARFHAQEEGKNIVSGAKAFAAMWRRMPQKQLKWVGETAERNQIFMGVLEIAYRGFLIVRPGVQWIFKRFSI